MAWRAGSRSTSNGLWLGRVDNDTNAMAYASTCTGNGGLMFRDMPSSGSALRFFDRFRSSLLVLFNLSFFCE